MTKAAFDFRKPPPGELGRQASKWLTSACRRAAGPWGRLLAFPAEPALGPVEVVGAAAGDGPGQAVADDLDVGRPAVDVELEPGRPA